ncbi:MAG: S8 family peptidase [Longimicrobiales bacterium]
MKKATLLLLALGFFLGGCGEVPSAPYDTDPIPDLGPGSALAKADPDLFRPEIPYVLVFNRGEQPADVNALVSEAGGTLLFSFPEVGLAVARGNDASFVRTVRRHPQVQAVGPTGEWSVPRTLTHVEDLTEPTPTDTYYQYYQWHIRRVGADQAWAAGATGSHGTVVAIIDTGVDATHPDLAPNVVFRACMQLGGPCPDDLLTSGHGTHVAGLVGAAFGGGRAIGVGPNLGLAGYQVFEMEGGAADGPIWWAILDAANRGFAVVNLSLGRYSMFGYGHAYGAAVWTAWNRVTEYATRAGVTVVASAGNEIVNVNGPLFHIPGDLPMVINVAATGIQPLPLYPQEGFFDIPAFYSNPGAAVTLSAPGGDCGELSSCTGSPPSGLPYFLYMDFSAYPGGYAWMGGTSQAAPHVAGAAGLIMDQNPDLTPRQVAAILTRTAENIGHRQIFGHGMLDVLAAVKAASR